MMVVTGFRRKNERLFKKRQKNTTFYGDMKCSTEGLKARAEIDYN